jgi:hypothetical protein
MTRRLLLFGLLVALVALGDPWDTVEANGKHAGERREDREP